MTLRPHRTGRLIAGSIGLFLALATVGCGGSGSDSKTSGGLASVKVMAIPGNAYRLPILVGEEEGIFSKRGIEVSFVDQPLTVSAPQALIATKAQVGFVSAPTVPQAWQADDDSVSSFCGGYDRYLTSFLALDESKLPTMDDGTSGADVLRALEGKKIGIQAAVGSGAQLLYAAALAEVGVEATWITTGGAANIATAALERGSVDVLATEPTVTQYMLDSGKMKKLLDLADGPEVFKTAYPTTWIAPRDWLKESPKEARAFCDGLQEAIDFINEEANRDAVSPLLQKDAGISPAIADLVFEDGVFESYNTEIPEDRYNKTLELLSEIGALKDEPKPSYEALVTIPAAD